MHNIIGPWLILAQVGVGMVDTDNLDDRSELENILEYSWTGQTPRLYSPSFN